jgi:hypothetical protein
VSPPTSWGYNDTTMFIKEQKACSKKSTTIKKKIVNTNAVTI